MSLGLGKCQKIRNIVTFRRVLKLWRKKAQIGPSTTFSVDRSAEIGASPVVPAGHVSVCVGPSRTRYTVRASHLNHPIFRRLLTEAEEEHGFSSMGPLALPSCDESLFEEILRVVTRPGGTLTLDDIRGCCRHVDIECIGESRPLIPEKSVY